MKILKLLFLFLPVLLLYSCQSYEDKKTVNASIDSCWQATLKSPLLKEADTTIMVKDENGNLLGFHQYARLIFFHEAIIIKERGAWVLKRFAIKQRSASGELSEDARIQRWIGLKSRNMVESCDSKITTLLTLLSSVDQVLVLKSKRKMYLRRNGVDLITFDINLGRNPVGNKEQEGDGRTPEGIYYLDAPQRRQDRFYKSFWISYPDSNDVRIAKEKGLIPGAGVMIHGTSPGRVNAKDWTNGCIALVNSDMDTLFKYVGIGTTIEIRK